MNMKAIKNKYCLHCYPAPDNLSQDKITSIFDFYFGIFLPIPLFIKKIFQLLFNNIKKIVINFSQKLII